jgi:hypothetical protein
MCTYISVGNTQAMHVDVDVQMLYSVRGGDKQQYSTCIRFCGCHTAYCAVRNKYKVYPVCAHTHKFSTTQSREVLNFVPLVIL